MNALRQAATILSLFAAAGAGAQQVHRCGDSNVYTDKPCENAEPVDLRSNTVPAVPTAPPPAPAEQPAPARILPNMSRVVTSPPSPDSTVWQDKDSRDGAATGRTTGTR